MNGNESISMTNRIKNHQIRSNSTNLSFCSQKKHLENNP